MKKIIFSLLFIFVLVFSINSLFAVSGTISVSGRQFWKFFLNPNTSAIDINGVVINDEKRFLPEFNTSDVEENLSSYGYYIYKYFDQNGTRFVNIYFSDSKFELETTSSDTIYFYADVAYGCSINLSNGSSAGWYLISDHGAHVSSVVQNANYIYSNNSFAHDGEDVDYNIGNPFGVIKINYEYSSDYKTCSVSATIEGGQFSDKLYYSFLPPTITGDLTTKQHFPVSSPLVIDKNCSIFFRAEDYQGNLKGVNSLVIDRIRNFSVARFDITSEWTTGRWLDIYPRLEGDSIIYYSMKYSYRYDEENYSEQLSVNNGDKLGFGFNLGQTFDINFYIYIKTDLDTPVMIKSYHFKQENWAKNDGKPDSSSTDGNLDPGNYGGFGNYDVNDPINSAKHFIDDSRNVFDMLGSIISAFPPWITVPISIFLVVSVIVTIVKLALG